MYQNALTKARLVSLLLPFHLPPSSFQARWLRLSKMTGCIPLCSVRFLDILPTSLCRLHRSFTFAEKSSEAAKWARNYSSAFYLDVKTSGYIHQTEFYACNIASKCHHEEVRTISTHHGALSGVPSRGPHPPTIRVQDDQNYDRVLWISFRKIIYLSLNPTPPPSQSNFKFNVLLIMTFLNMYNVHV